MAKYIEIDKDSNNPTARVPICLCLDLSGSMDTIEGGNYTNTGRKTIIDGKEYNIVEGGTSRLDELRSGLTLLFDAIKEDDMAVDAAEISIVGFDDEAYTLLRFAHIEDQEIPTLETGNSTSMGEGVNLALDLLEERKRHYKDKGIQYYQPWLVLMTDGENNGSKSELERAVRRIKELVDLKKLSVFPIGIGNEADMTTLAKFSPKRRPLRLKGLKFKEFFEWLSQSVSKVSVSTPGEDVDLPPVSDWGTL